jgi:hypothetical protein
MQLFNDDSFREFLSRLIKAYVNACDYADQSYLEAQLPRPGFTRGPRFNWLAQAERRKSFELPTTHGSIMCSVVDFRPALIENFELDVEPELSLLDTDDGIAGSLAFPRARFSLSAMQRLVENYVILLEALVQRPDGPVVDVPLTQ